MAGDPITSALGYSFVLMPVGLNVAIMLLMALVINRLCLQHNYPAGKGQISDKTKQIGG
jgi:CBS domain-containing membrane protein